VLDVSQLALAVVRARLGDRAGITSIVTDVLAWQSDRRTTSGMTELSSTSSLPLGRHLALGVGVRAHNAGRKAID
jgi:hypothetical protein